MLCTNKDKKDLLDFLYKKKTENTFFIGGIENLDLESDITDVWKFETEGKISSVLLRYYKFYLLSVENDNDLERIAEIVCSDEECRELSGLEETIDKITAFMEFKKIKKTFLASVNKNTFNEIETNLKPIKAVTEDIDYLFDFQKSIEEFNISEKNRDIFGKDIINGTGRMYFIKEDKKIVSSATVTAENSVNGMIIGVATDKKYRNKGYAMACVMKICKEMIESGKSVSLFYHNPNAGKLYKKLGFVDVGKWSIGTIRE